MGEKGERFTGTIIKDILTTARWGLLMREGGGEHWGGGKG